MHRTRSVFVAVLVSLLAGVAAGQPAPGAKGTPYKAPGQPGDLKSEILWAGQCEEPAGGGLAFSGQSQVADDGQPHTRIKVDGEWKPIVEELRKNNRLQRDHDDLWRMRTRVKDVATRARFIYFEGRAEADEKAYLKSEVNPEITKVRGDILLLTMRREKAEDFTDGTADLRSIAQEKIVVPLKLLMPIDGVVTPEILANLRVAQQDLEVAAEALDAEPPPRVCSPIVYDATSKLYVLFGGDHFDYLTNDTWVFDPAKRRWFQRHPNGAPPPRADHSLKVADGKVTLSGGYVYSSKTDYGSNQYSHVGDGEWVYDVAKNTWASSGNATTQPADTRLYRTGPYIPEYFMKGDRPDAAANEAKLKALPVNAWTNMKVPHALSLNRDWGTAAMDTDRDMVVYWSGGHCVHSGSDVPHYHLATNRWELPFPIEMPLGFIGASGIGVQGRNFSGRPWMSNHTDNCYTYDAGLKKLVVVGRNNHKRDHYTYLYDPDRGDWADRLTIPDGMNVANMEVNVRATPKGTLAWTRDAGRLYLLNGAAMKWEPIKFEAAAGVQLPAPMVDNCGLVYDPKRDRVLFVHKFYGEKSLFSGQIYALDMKTFKLTVLTPAGADKLGAMFGGGQLREAVYDPASDLFLWADWLPNGRMLGYDPAGDRWVGLDVRGPAPFTVSTGLVFDPKRKLVWLIHGSGRAGDVFVLRFDGAKADAKPAAE